MALAMGVDDFCFLSPNYFMIVIPRGYLDVYSFSDPAIYPEYPALKRRFGLPRLKSGYYYWYISAMANPTPGSGVAGADYDSVDLEGRGDDDEKRASRDLDKSRKRLQKEMKKKRDMDEREVDAMRRRLGTREGMEAADGLSTEFGQTFGAGSSFGGFQDIEADDVEGTNSGSGSEDASSGPSPSNSQHAPFVNVPAMAFAPPPPPAPAPATFPVPPPFPPTPSPPLSPQRSWFSNSVTDTPQLPAPQPFTPRPDDGLIACSLGTLNPAAQAAVDCFVFFVKVSTLLDLAQGPPPTSSKDKGKGKSKPGEEELRMEKENEKRQEEGKGKGKAKEMPPPSVPAPSQRLPGSKLLSQVTEYPSSSTPSFSSSASLSSSSALLSSSASSPTSSRARTKPKIRTPRPFTHEVTDAIREFNQLANSVLNSRSSASASSSSGAATGASSSSGSSSSVQRKTTEKPLRGAELTKAIKEFSQFVKATQSSTSSSLPPPSSASSSTTALPSSLPATSTAELDFDDLALDLGLYGDLGEGLFADALGPPSSSVAEAWENEIAQAGSSSSSSSSGQHAGGSSGSSASRRSTRRRSSSTTALPNFTSGGSSSSFFTSVSSSLLPSPGPSSSSHPHPHSSHSTIAHASSSTSTTAHSSSSSSRHRTNNNPRTSSTFAKSVSIPWEEWGPPATRWFNDMLSSDWQHAVHGFRTVEKVPVPSPSTSTTPAQSQGGQEEGGPADSDSLVANDGSVDVEVGDDAMEVDVIHGGDSGEGQDGEGAGASVVGPGLSAAGPSQQQQQQQQQSVPQAPAPPVNANAGNGAGGGQGNGNGNSTAATMHRIRIRDWNPYTIRRAQMGLEPTTEPEDVQMRHDNDKGKGKARATDSPVGNGVMRGCARLVTEPSRIPAGTAFVEDIVSYLPYREVVSEEAVEVSDVMMDDARVLCLKVRPLFCFVNFTGRRMLMTLLFYFPFFLEGTKRAIVRYGRVNVLSYLFSGASGSLL